MLSEMGWSYSRTMRTFTFRWVWSAGAQGASTVASNHFEYALLFNPDWAEAHLDFGQYLLMLGDVPNGLKHLQQAAHLAPDSPLALTGWPGCWPPAPMPRCVTGRKRYSWLNVAVQ